MRIWVCLYDRPVAPAGPLPEIGFVSHIWPWTVPSAPISGRAGEIGFVWRISPHEIGFVLRLSPVGTLPRRGQIGFVLHIWSRRYPPSGPNWVRFAHLGSPATRPPAGLAGLGSFHIPYPKGSGLAELGLFDTGKRETCGGRLSRAALGSWGPNLSFLSSVLAVCSVIRHQEGGWAKSRSFAPTGRSGRLRRRPLIYKKTLGGARMLCKNLNVCRNSSSVLFNHAWH